MSIQMLWLDNKSLLLTLGQALASNCRSCTGRSHIKAQAMGRFRVIKYSHLGLNGNHVLDQVYNPVAVPPAMEQQCLDNFRACCCQ